MGKGGGQQNSTVVNTNLPEYAQPYVDRLFKRAETESQRPYQVYGGDRFVDPNSIADTQAGEGIIRDYGGNIEGSNQAQYMLGRSAVIADDAFRGPRADYSAYQFDPAGEYTAGTVSQYMSPYMQNVVDIEKQKAMQDFQEQQQYRDAQAAQSGAFGGSRGAIVDSQAQSDLATQMAEIQARGLQDSFTTGAGLFEADRAARLGVDQSQAAEQGRVQGSRDAQNQAYSALQMQAAGLQGDLGMDLARLGSAERAALMEQAGLLRDMGQQDYSYEQSVLDTNYEDFLRQQYYNTEQLNRYSDLLRGHQRGMDSTQTQLQGGNSFARDLLGAGITGLSLNRAGEI